MPIIDRIALVLVIVGALNWGLVGLFRFDLVATLVGLTFGEVNSASAIIYALVALSGIVLLRQLTRPAVVMEGRTAHSS